jgi:hypothetical protein
MNDKMSKKRKRAKETIDESGVRKLKEKEEKNQ